MHVLGTLCSVDCFRQKIFTRPSRLDAVVFFYAHDRKDRYRRPYQSVMIGEPIEYKSHFAVELDIKTTYQTLIDLSIFFLRHQARNVSFTSNAAVTQPLVRGSKT